MKRAIILTLVAANLLLAGCGDKGKELFETARFEEKQNNSEHAIKLYEEIVANYPQSEFAKKAGERLAVLKKGK